MVWFFLGIIVFCAVIALWVEPSATDRVPYDGRDTLSQWYCHHNSSTVGIDVTHAILGHENKLELPEFQRFLHGVPLAPHATLEKSQADVLNVSPGLVASGLQAADWAYSRLGQDIGSIYGLFLYGLLTS